MQISGSVTDSKMGTPIPRATIWAMAADGRSSDVVGYSDGAGKFSLNAPDGLQIMFSADGYISAAMDQVTIAESNSVQLDPDAVAAAVKKIPAGVWVAALGLLLVMASKKS